MKNRRANSVVFGFDFQINAAIVLMLENMRELKSIKLEGNYEDIELCYNDGKYVFAQAKSIIDPINDVSNVHKNLKKALTTLSEAGNKIDAKQLIFITNSRNPFKEKINISSFEGESHRSYDSLSQQAKDLIDKYLNEIKEPLDTSKFMIQILPFETDRDDERYKIVKSKIDEFIADLHLRLPGLEKKIMKIWQNDIFRNATKSNVGIKLTKSKIIWPIIYTITDIKRYDDGIFEIIDESIYDDICQRYYELIEIYSEKISFFTKVIYDYIDFNSNSKRSEKMFNFIENNWVNYKGDFLLLDDDIELERGLIQVILYTILKNQLSIKKIKEGVGL